VEILDNWLKPTDVGLEWGSGNSTTFFAERVAHLISIEHDSYWYNRVSKALHDKGLKNVEIIHVPLKQADKEEPEYVSVITKQPKGSFDFILVDGCFRDQCAELGLQLLKPGGILITDDAARYVPHPYCCPQSLDTAKGPPSELWAKVIKKLQELEARTLWVSDGVSSTAFYIMPASKP